MSLCCSVVYTLESISCEAGGKDLKATQVYPGQLGLRVHTSTSHVGQSVNPLRQILPSIWGCRKIGVPMCGPQTYLFKLKNGAPLFWDLPIYLSHAIACIMIQLRCFRSIDPGRSASPPSSPYTWIGYGPHQRPGHVDC